MTYDIAGTRWEHCVIRTLAEVPSVVKFLVEALRPREYSEKEFFGVRLSLEEAIVNAIKHGNGEDPAKTVQIRYRATPRHFVIEIQDEGAGFDPNSLPDAVDPENMERPSGRGVILMQHFMTWVRYNEAGNCVTLCKIHAGSSRPCPTTFSPR